MQIIKVKCLKLYINHLKAIKLQKFVKHWQTCIFKLKFYLPFLAKYYMLSFTLNAFHGVRCVYNVPLHEVWWFFHKLSDWLFVSLFDDVSIKKSFWQNVKYISTFTQLNLFCSISNRYFLSYINTRELCIHLLPFVI